MEFSTAPGVIIAVPQLLDTNFHRSVVVMVEHNADGALGLVVNHPTSHACRAVCEELELEWAGGLDARLLKGGPVEPHSMWMLHDDGWGFAETMRVAPGVAVSRSREALRRMLEGGERRILLLVGYAGWGPGQLEAELGTGSWISSGASAAMLFDWPRELVWARSLEAMGIDPAQLVSGSGTVQ